MKLVKNEYSIGLLVRLQNYFQKKMRPIHSFPLILLIIYSHSLHLTSAASVHKMADNKNKMADYKNIMAAKEHKMAAIVSPVQPLNSGNRQGKMLGKFIVLKFYRNLSAAIASPAATNFKKAVYYY